MKSNREWAQEILNRVDPAFKHRWDVFMDEITSLLTPDDIWIDCGCGGNGLIGSYGHLAKEAYGVDVSEPMDNNSNFIKADIKNLPFPSAYADLVTLRFVVEHFDYPKLYFSEIERILKKDGKVLIITTNLISPIIYIPKLILPYSLKNKIISILYKVDSKDIFPTYHKLNTKGAFKTLHSRFDIFKIKYLSDLNYNRKWIFFLLLLWHLITRYLRLEFLRTNLLVILRKV